MNAPQFRQLPKLTSIVWKTMKQASPVLAWAGATLFTVSMVSLFLMWIDHRVFQGVSVWHKPWKFQLSTALYFYTLAFFLSYLPKNDKLGVAWRYVVWMSLAAGLFEVGYITWQGAFGLASHYNVSSSFYATMYTAMGVGAVLLTSTSGVLGYQVLRSKAFATTLAMQHAIGWGLVMTCALGIVTGAVLGERTRSGGHWVGGTANDALGMAVFNWSRDGGDLRVAHFFALHAMQILPLIAIALMFFVPTMPQTKSKRSLWLIAIAYSAFCIFTLLQALHGIPFLG